MKKEINILQESHRVLYSLANGALLTTKLQEKVNTMTIGWGTIGIEWKEPVFIAFVRQSRYTKEILDATGEFTINVPNQETDPRILSYCGTHSGKDTDKILDLGLTLVDPEQIKVPAIKELPLTLECQVLYSQAQEYDLLPETIQRQYYPIDDSKPVKEKPDVHTMYIAKIIKAYEIID